MNIARNNIENLDKEKEKKKMNILKGNGEKVITFFIRLIAIG